MKIAAIGDLHCQSGRCGQIETLLADVDQAADALILAGDLTHRGRIEEMQALLEGLQPYKLPIIAVLGNHDHEQNHAEMLVRMLEGQGICVLDCSSCVVQGVGFIGTKGFCGGFGARRIQPFGEAAIKTFVQTSVDEVVRMEAALAQLQADRVVGVLHYAPIRETLQGESPELYPFLGSSLTGEAFDRHQVEIIVHGHAHHGIPRGYTPGGVPVYNVSHFVRTRSDLTPYLLFEIGAEGLVATDTDPRG